MNDRTAPPLRVVPYYSPESHTTCYIVATRQGTGAILVDPVQVDTHLYELFLRLQVEIRWVLVTHPEEYMRRSMRTLCRIYDYQVIAGEAEFFGHDCHQEELERGTPMVLDGMRVEAIPFLPHSRSSFVYRIGNCFFSGSIIHAGSLGETPSDYNEELLVAGVKDHIFTLPGAERDCLLLPSVGPPSTVRAEMHLSPYYREFETVE